MEDIEINLTHKAAWLLQQGRLRLTYCDCGTHLGELINDTDIECLDCGEICLPADIPGPLNT